jgi:hypothetical protein
VRSRCPVALTCVPKVTHAPKLSTLTCRHTNRQRLCEWWECACAAWASASAQDKGDVSMHGGNAAAGCWLLVLLHPWQHLTLRPVLPSLLYSMAA